LSQQELARIAQPYHVTLTKNTKGFSWEISVHAETIEDVLASIDYAQKELSAKYGKEEGGQ
jgi:hypothetical protein